ncbi:MAG: hypothetical protein PHN68_07685 [Prolixibacteraceae bacterium]|jgi:hypothetical protein|nr:hypothetical protein [Prolixibacteraceae bacterium]
MPKITQKQIDALDKLLNSPATLQKMGAALVHNMKDQLKAGRDIKEIVLPLTEAPKLDFASPVSDSVGVGVNDYVSVSWSKDIDSIMRDKINTKIRGASKLQAARVIKQVMPKGLETGKRLKLSR